MPPHESNAGVTGPRERGGPLDGLPLNAHAAAASMPEAISLAGTRLRARVESTAQYKDRGTVRRHGGAPGEGVRAGR
ncbi:hypothetical protein [Actinomadura sp. NPDC049753]|uniref:hypothetical protein n=1 Tax=Actinomadura sp. NPDC049753 TaxID=3154739 RepID=UPI0034397B77